MPISIWPNPSADSPKIAWASLSYPAAKPTWLGKLIPKSEIFWFVVGEKREVNKDLSGRILPARPINRRVSWCAASGGNLNRIGLITLEYISIDLGLLDKFFDSHSLVSAYQSLIFEQINQFTQRKYSMQPVTGIN